MIEIEKYTYHIIWSDEDEEFVGLCEEFPSLSYLDSCQEVALKGIVQLVKSVVDNMVENGEVPPNRSYTKNHLLR